MKGNSRILAAGRSRQNHMPSNLKKKHEAQSTSIVAMDVNHNSHCFQTKARSSKGDSPALSRMQAKQSTITKNTSKKRHLYSGYKRPGFIIAKGTDRSRAPPPRAQAVRALSAQQRGQQPASMGHQLRGVKQIRSSACSTARASQSVAVKAHHN